jgi:hypothetical protein
MKAKIKIVYVIIVFLVLIGFRIYNQYQSIFDTISEEVYDEINHIIETDTGIVCVLIPQKTYYRIGENPQINVLLINKTDRTIYLPGCLDGSSIPFRLPYCDVKLLNRKKIMPRMLCGMTNPMRESDLQMLKPNECFNPLNRYWLQIETFPPDSLLNFNESVITELSNYFPPAILDGQDFLIPGEYQIQFVYSTMPDSTIFFGWNTSADFRLELFDSIPQISITSNIVKLKYRIL